MGPPHSDSRYPTLSRPLWLDRSVQLHDRLEQTTSSATFMSEESATLPVRLQQYVGKYSTTGVSSLQVHCSSAFRSWPFFALQKHLVGGLTAGGVKG